MGLAGRQRMEADRWVAYCSASDCISTAWLQDVLLSEQATMQVRVTVQVACIDG